MKKNLRSTTVLGFLVFSAGCASAPHHESEQRTERKIQKTKTPSKSSAPITRLQPKSSHLVIDQVKTSQAKNRYGANRSQEWRNLPTQRWEQTQFKLPPGIDKQGIGILRAGKKAADKGIDLDRIIYSEKQDRLGEIKRSNAMGAFVGPGDTVYVDGSPSDFQIGKTYTVSEPPTKLKGGSSGNSGYVYLLHGRVKITRQEDDWLIGQVVSGNFPSERNHFLIAEVPRFRIPAPLAAPQNLSGLRGSMRFDKHLKSSYAAQNHIVFIDRGTQDGIQPGMVFGFYELKDPYNNRSLPLNPDTLKATVLIINPSEEVSTAIILSSKTTLDDNIEGIILTDLSVLNMKSFERAAPIRFADTPNGETSKENKRDELEDLDDDDHLTEQEKRELKQLEKWEKNPAPDTAPAPTTGDAPPDDLLPPESPPAGSVPPPAPESLPPSAPAQTPPAAGGDAPPDDLLPPP